MRLRNGVSRESILTATGAFTLNCPTGDSANGYRLTPIAPAQIPISTGFP